MILGIDQLEGWKVAIRPHTLPASLAPVLVGSGLAWHHGVFYIPAVLMALLVAIFLQVAVNLANDYYDYQKGVDSDERVGFPRACNSGLLSPDQVRTGLYLTLALALFPGGYLVAQGGFPLLLAGLASLLAVIGYSGGPLPYGSYALGDIMVFVFFGLVAATGTYYVNVCARLVEGFPMVPPDGSLSTIAFLVAIPSGVLSTAILVINNLRDHEQDRAAGKYTLAVPLGKTGSLAEFGGLLAMAYAVPMIVPLLGAPLASLLPLLTLPLGLNIFGTLCADPDPETMNESLSRTGQLLFLHNLLFAVGLAL